MVTIDGTDISGATIDGTDVQEITVDGETVWTAFTLEKSHLWRMDEGSGSTISDSEGNIDLSQNGTSWVFDSNSVGNYYIDSNGSSLTNSTQSELTTLDWSFGAWLKMPSVGNDDFRLIIGSEGDRIADSGGDGLFIFAVGDGSEILRFTGWLEDDKWYFVGVTVEASTNTASLYAWDRNSQVYSDSKSFPGVFETSETSYQLCENNGTDGGMDYTFIAKNQVMPESEFEKIWENTR